MHTHMDVSSVSCLSHLRLSLSLNMPLFEVEAVVHEYHVYKEIWNPFIGEELFELHREHDSHACDCAGVQILAELIL